LHVDDEIFKNKTSEFDLKQNIYTSKVNLYHTYKKWNIIEGKNFLCFSPTGDFLALSEQGYDPLTIGGYGHQESNVVHIAQTKSGKIFNSFIGHGEKIKDNKAKKIAFVAFSDDESRIMTLSTDGVVFIRDLKIKDL
jgi:WD40 repeat protein